MSRAFYQYLQQWCQEHDWTDLFVEQCQFWAFPPGSVIPVPIPTYALEGFYRKRKISIPSRLLNVAAIGVSLCAVIITVLTHSPIPLLSAFGFCAIAVALLEEELF
jgi:hypothetical protein